MDNRVVDEKKLLSTLGLCVRAEKVIFGVPMICEAMRRGGAMTVFEASDTSDNTHKKLSDKCAYYKIKRIRLPIGGETLAAALGKTSSLAAVAVTEPRMSEMVEKTVLSDKQD